MEVIEIENSNIKGYHVFHSTPHLGIKMKVIYDLCNVRTKLYKSNICIIYSEKLL